jgi:hypothetical protein
MTDSRGDAVGVGARVGARLRCDSCRAEAVVTTGGDADLNCCGAPLSVIFQPAATEAPGGTQG